MKVNLQNTDYFRIMRCPFKDDRENDIWYNFMVVLNLETEDCL